MTQKKMEVLGKRKAKRTPRAVKETERSTEIPTGKKTKPIEEPQPPKEEVSTSKVVVNAGLLNVRQTSSSTSAVIDRVKRGDVLTIISVVENEEESWGQRTNGGFVVLRYCKKA